MSQRLNTSDESTPSVDDLLRDLDAERRILRQLVEQATPSEFDALTPSPGWTVRDQIAHLAFYDGMAALALTDPAQFTTVERATADADTEGYGRSHLDRVPRGRAELLAKWDVSATKLTEAARTAEPGTRTPWYALPMSVKSFVTARIMETWAHGQDVADSLGATREPTDRLRHVATLAFRARPYSYVVRGLPAPDAEMRVELTGPGGDEWTFGDAEAPDVVQGPAEDFCLVLTRRRHVEDTAVRTAGPRAREWMEIGQAFAGPPGPDPKRMTSRAASPIEQER